MGTLLSYSAIAAKLRAMQSRLIGEEQLRDGWDDYNDAVKSYEKQKAEAQHNANADQLLPFFVTSTWRVVVSVALGTILAVPIAQFCARSKTLDGLFAPVLYLLYPIPKVVLLPILLVLLGLADAPKIVLITLTVFFQVLVATRDAVLNIPETAFWAIRSLGGNRWHEYWHVVVPATLPAVFTSLRIGVGTAIAVLFIAEAMAGSTGLGYFIMQSWSMVNYPRMFAGIIAMAILGVVLYAAFDIAERRMMVWR